MQNPLPAASGGSTTVGITFSYPPGAGISYSSPSKTMNIFSEPGFGNTKVYWNGYHLMAFANPGPDTAISNIISPDTGYQQNLNNYNGYVWENSYYWGWDSPAVNDYVAEGTFMYVSSSTHTPPLDNNQMPVFVTGSIAHYQNAGNGAWASTALYVTWAYNPQWFAYGAVFQNTGYTALTFTANTGSFTSLGGLGITLTNHGDPWARLYEVWVNNVQIDNHNIYVTSGSSTTFYYNIQNLISANAQVTLKIVITTYTTDYYWSVTSWMFADPSHT